MVTMQTLSGKLYAITNKGTETKNEKVKYKEQQTRAKKKTETGKNINKLPRELIDLMHFGNFYSCKQEEFCQSC